MTKELDAKTARPQSLDGGPASTSATQQLRTQIEQLRDRVKVGLGELKTVQKAVAPLLATGALEDIQALDTQLAALRKAKLDDVAFTGDRDALVESLTAHLQQRRAELRRGVLGTLQRALTTEGLELLRLGDSPPSFFVAPVTVTLDFDSGRAMLSYAREPVLDTKLDAQAIIEGRVLAMERIRAGAVDSPAFFDLLRRAYEMVLTAGGLAFGERVDLVDLRLPLALLRVETKRWRRLNLTKVPSYERYQLAYQLQRLRRDGLLEKDGLRLDLGTATGGTTRQKRNVLFIPQATGEGQYYLSLRFVKTG